MDKQYILDEIRRTAAENGGIALGKERFQKETGIAVYDWYGKHWRSWGDAVREAGFEPRQMATAYDEAFMMATLAAFVRELGRYPSAVDFRMRARSEKGFPSRNAFSRIGTKAELASKVIRYCRDVGEMDDVIELCDPVASTSDDGATSTASRPSSSIGYVYLMKSGRFHKIGHSNAPGRRSYELAIQLPERLQLVHAIKTDDPEGIERYWHERFSSRRKNGEWFELSADDIAAFKRRKFM